MMSYDIRKGNIRVLAIDDSPFTFSDERTQIIGIVSKGPTYMEIIMKEVVVVDGHDSTEKIISMVKGSHLRDQIRLILLDGASFGGFNIFDPEYIFHKLNIPLITVCRRNPDLISIKQALIKNFPDWEERYAVLTKNVIQKTEIPGGHLYIKRFGINPADSQIVINNLLVNGKFPEPLRQAHMVASILKRNISKGKA